MGGKTVFDKRKLLQDWLAELHQERERLTQQTDLVRSENEVLFFKRSVIGATGVENLVHHLELREDQNERGLAELEERIAELDTAIQRIEHRLLTLGKGGIRD
jgi:phage shock protein A